MKRYRSFLFMPGHQEKYYASVQNYTPDCLVLDLEDSVPDCVKELAKQVILSHSTKLVFSGMDFFIRVRNTTVEFAKLDMLATIHAKISGYVIPKAEDPAEIRELIEFVNILEKEMEIESNSIQLILLIETPLGLLKAFEMAKQSTRILGVGLGAEDYIASIDGVFQRETLLYPRSHLIAVAKACGIQCIDTVYFDIQNLDGFRGEVEYAKSLGFDGKFLIHPSQIEITNETFGYSFDEILKMKRLIEEFERVNIQECKGVALIEGKFYEAPHINRLKNIIDLYKG